MAYNPNILKEALQARRLTPEQLSARLGLGASELNSQLQREPEPNPGIIKSVARELALPPFVFYMEHLPELAEGIPDFRTSTPAPRAKSRETVEAIKLAEGIQKTLRANAAEAAAPLPVFAATSDSEIERFALEMRLHFGISLDDQRGARDARQFYVTVRRKIEDKGITVLQGSFPRVDGSGFCLADHLYPVILINSNQQTRARRLFTLAHELAHALVGATGISDPSERNNTIERRCNRFATSFLVPKSFVAPLVGSTVVREPDPDDVKFAARRLKVSFEAAVLRLEQLDFYKAGSHSRWRAMVSGNNPDYAQERGGSSTGKPPEQEKVKLAKYGFRLARAFKAMVDAGLITDLNLYRASGLKPKYQRPYFQYVTSLSPNELHDLELDDG